MKTLIALATLLAATAAADAAPDREAWKAAMPSGKAESCIFTRQIRQTRVRDDRTIDFIMAGRDKVYRNTLPQPCPQLGFEKRFGYVASTGQLCSTDIITVLPGVSTALPGPSCGLGAFQPVTGAGR